MRQRSCKRAGFTLVEVIVTLVVLGILAAIAVPAMTGWVDESRVKSCEATRKSLLESYSAYRAIHRVQDDVVDAGFPGFLNSEKSLGQEPKCPSGGVYTMANGEVMCSTHGVTEHPPQSLLIAAMAGAGADGGSLRFAGTNIDSSASGDTSSRTTAIMAWLQAQGLDLASLGVVSWKLQGTGGGDSSTIRLVTWTDQQVLNTPAGSYVRVIRYDAKPDGGDLNKTFTVGYVKVGIDIKDQPYNVLVNPNARQNWLDGRQQFASYGEAMAAYSKLDGTKKK